MATDTIKIGPGDIATVPKSEYDALKKDFEKAQRQLAEAKESNQGLCNKLSAAEELAGNLQAYIAQADHAEGLDYVLTPITPNNPCSRYDGMADEPPQFVWHETMDFRNDTGYDATVLYDRFKASVDRFVGADSGGRIEPGCTNLPPFNKANKLEIIMRLVVPE